MKIKYYLAILIVACLGLGYGMEAILSNYQQKKQVMIEMEHQYSIAAKDINRLNDDIQQYLISVDLILGSDQNYLLPGALKKSTFILQQTHPKENTLLHKNYADPLSQSNLLIGKIHTILKKSKSLPYDNRKEKLYALLVESDNISYTLTSLLEDTEKQLLREYENHRTTTQKNIKEYQSSSYVIRFFYGLLIFFSWLWIYTRISKPIEILIQHAKIIGTTEDLTMLHEGPKEIQFLSQQIESTAKKLLYQALHDPLTGLYNRREFSRRIKSAFLKDQEILLKRAQFDSKKPIQKGRIKVLPSKPPEQQHPLCICLIDLDRFKSVNDNCSHSAGDELLKLAANEIRETVGKGHVVSRLGGDEFGILFKNTAKDECIRKVDLILEKIRCIHFERDGSIYRISASIGITFVTDTSISISEWINTADTGCFAAKDNGRDNRQIITLNDDRLNSIRNDTKVYNDVIKALEDDRFVLYHQHITGIQEDNKDDNYFEILVRMVSENNDIVEPYYFMDIVERFDLFSRLDQWVVSHTIEWLEAHPDKLALIDTCSINLSGKSLANKDMHDFLKELMKKTSVPAHKICFEITETAAVNDINQAKRLINSLRSIGCRFALDDFGSGLSSFAYLQSLEVDIIKIDGLFIKNLASSQFDQVMVNNINELAKNVNMKTIAEFVETKDIVDIIQKIGINYAQGFHFHKPEALDNFNPIRTTTVTKHTTTTTRKKNV